MAKAKPRVRVPKSASKGEIIEIKTLISHTMESGQRKDRKTGELIPRKIINRFSCTYNGEEVFAMDLHPSISANPYITFHIKAEESGELEFSWVDDDGSVYSSKASLTVN